MRRTRDAAITRLKDADVPLSEGANDIETRDPFGTRVRFTR